MLKDSVEELKRELAKLKESLSAAQYRSTASIATDEQQAQPTYTTATHNSESDTASTNTLRVNVTYSNPEVLKEKYPISLSMVLTKRYPKT